MLFTGPLWLWLLLPWLGVVIWQWWGRRNRVAVPFLDLWRSELPPPSKRRAFTPPPLAIVMILLAALLAILAAAGPTVHWTGRGGRAMTIILDRGLTMSQMQDDQRRFVAAAERVNRAAESLAQLGPIQLMTVPSQNGDITQLPHWLSFANELAPTALDTFKHVQSATQRTLTEVDGPVLLLSDARLDISSDLFAQVVPEPISSVQIEHVAARAWPSPQVMVRLQNSSDRSTAIIRVRSGRSEIAKAIDLPPRNASKNVFIDPNDLLSPIEISIDGATVDDPAGRAWLVRASAWPKVELNSAVPAAVGRVIDAYEVARPAADDAPIVAVTTDPAAIGPQTPAAIVAGGGTVVGADDAEAVVVDHRLTGHVDWNAAVRGARLTEAPGDWMPVVSVAGRAVIAAQEGDVRRVWIGIDSPTLPRLPAFVVLWTNVLDWLGQVDSSEAGEFVYERVDGVLDKEWQPLTGMPNPRPLNGQWPGLYERRGDGALRALNAPIIDPSNRQGPSDDWRGALQRWARQSDRRRVLELAPALLIVAMACLLLAALRWRAR